MNGFISNSSARVNDRIRDDYTAGLDSPSSASSSSDDVFSNGDARSSQSSAPSSVKGSPLNYDSEVSSERESFNHQGIEQSFSRAAISRCQTRVPAVAAELRRHPRRTAVSTAEVSELKHDDESQRKPVPSLIRQCDRKEQFVEALVDTTTEMIEVIWPLSVAQCNISQGAKNILGLRKFVQEVLRRSKTSYSTLQVALFYMVLLIQHVPRPDAPECRDDAPIRRALRCGRRMFLAALILASKYLQDRNYTMLAWAKISGLKKEEICFNELAFLRTVSYDLHIPELLFKDWADIVLKYSLEDDCRRARALNGGRCEKWRAIVPYLTKDLSNVLNLDADALLKQSTPPWTRQWTTTSSPASPGALSRSESPVDVSSFAKPPPPRFLEPKAMTSAEIGLRSPKLSKLETPCLPPINFDCAPAASGSRCSVMGRPSIGLAMQHVGAASLNRACTEGFPTPQRLRTMPCVRKSCLSASNSSPVQNGGECDIASWGRRSASPVRASAIPALRARESCLRASSSAEPSCDEAASAARTLQDLSRASSAYPTPLSMDSMTDGSSVASDGEELSTPRVASNGAICVSRPCLKRERPLSICELGTGESAMAHAFAGLPNIVKHAGGIPVDYGAGIEDMLDRSRHVRSASGSYGSSRKRNRRVEI